MHCGIWKFAAQGNILGDEQSGHIQLVGYQMYCELLAEAVRKLKNEPKEETAPPAGVDLGFAAYIPKSYIPLDRYRMDVYRKIAMARYDEDVKQITDELMDVYGPMPEDVKTLLEIAEIRITAGRCRVKSIVVSGQDLVFSFGEGSTSASKSLFAKVHGTVRFSDAKTVYLRLSKNYFEPKTLTALLRKMFTG